MGKNQAKEILELVLHPVRMRIFMLLSGSPGLTPQQMAEQMGDIPQATLYRHINRLAQAGMLVVTEERPVRGTLEKVYALNTAHQPTGSTEESLEAINQLSEEDHLHYFTAFLLTMMDDFSQYLKLSEGAPRNLAADGVGYQKLPLYLNDEEFAAFAAALNHAIAPFIGLKNGTGRKKRLFSTIMMPTA
jgi:DNA-binding transcriptional ArsR family regulator